MKAAFDVFHLGQTSEGETDASQNHHGLNHTIGAIVFIGGRHIVIECGRLHRLISLRLTLAKTIETAKQTTGQSIAFWKEKI